MSTSADNLIQGPGHIFVAPYGTALPSASDISGLLAGTVMGWTSVGETTSAVDLTDTPTWVKATSQQQARTIDAAVSAISTTIKTTLREVDLSRLEDVVRGTADTSGADFNTVTPSGIGPAPKVSLAVVGAWPAGQKLLLVAERVIHNTAQTLSFATDKYTEIAVEFEILTPSSAGPVGGYEIFVTKIND